MIQKLEDALVERESDTVPWTIQQTSLGIIFTLIPWIVLAIGLSQLNQGSVPQKTLSFQTDLGNAIFVFLLSCIIEGAFLIAPLSIANRAFRSITPHLRLALKALGFRSFSIGRSLLLVALLLITILAVDNLYQYLITALGLNLQTNDQILLQHSKIAPISTYATLLAAVIVAPFCEEIFFRGFVFAGLCKAMPVGWAIVCSSLLFALAHADPGSFTVLFIIGLALAFLRWRTKSLWPCIFLHALNNGLGALLIILTMQGIVKP
ncbi:MAG TPA: CPBP family intramembrane glutamic endopeptidase [Ktedonobacteraceae bacterium]|nr:CPBP family intramembrane glutamic endopeptidase [Ktedonobacteraceae bacterium]